jgi:hypothetical protein
MKRRSSRQRDKSLLDYKRNAPLGIGPKVETAQTWSREDELVVVLLTRRAVWALHSSCQACGGARSADCGGFPDEMHEEPPRSATRGRPPAERFNLIVCGRLCKACHIDVTEHRIKLVLSPVLGFLGPVEVDHG